MHRIEEKLWMFYSTLLLSTQVKIGKNCHKSNTFVGIFSRTINLIICNIISPSSTVICLLTICESRWKEDVILPIALLV